MGLQTTSLEVPASQRAGEGMMIGWTSGVPRNVVERIGDSQVAYPEGFTVHPKLEAMLAKRRRATREGGIDWGMGELIAFGSLLMEGVPVRVVGEDARRATFAQRHAVLHDHDSGAEWTPLEFLTPDQATLSIYDSLLSEYAALGFEYGYAVERPEGLTVWEAQFGDFANGAQSVIDEYITSAGQKWGQRSGLVMLLPHGQEGQGPDHSSARIERYLQMCAQGNMRVAMPSTPANHFHLLREHAYSRPRRPLVVFTPKQLLRLKAASSQVEDFTSGAFLPVIGEVDERIGAGAGSTGCCCARVGRTTRWPRSGPNEETPQRRSSASSSSTRCRRPSWPRRWRPTRTPSSSSSRTRPRTRGSGRGSPCTCPRRSPVPDDCGSSPLPRPPPRPSAASASTGPSRRRSWRPLSSGPRPTLRPTPAEPSDPEADARRSRETAPSGNIDRGAAASRPGAR